MCSKLKFLIELKKLVVFIIPVIGNVKRESGEKDWIDLARQVEKWRPVEDSKILLTASADNSDGREHLQAKIKEIDNW